jgi:hypothetical protein
MPVLRWEVKRGLDIVEEFYTDESKSEQHQQTDDLTHVQDIQKGLQQSCAGFELIRRKHHGCTYGSIFSDESNYYY